MNVIICIRWGQIAEFTDKAARKFNWWMNDITFALIVLLFAYPYLLKGKIEYCNSQFANLFFFLLLVANICMVMTNYLHGDLYDNYFVFTKLTLAGALIVTIPVNNFFTKEE